MRARRCRVRLRYDKTSPASHRSSVSGPSVSSAASPRVRRALRRNSLSCFPSTFLRFAMSIFSPSETKVRFAVGAVGIAGAFFLPWWVPLACMIGLSLRYPAWEVLFLGLVIDLHCIGLQSWYSAEVGFFRRTGRSHEIAPDEIFLDSSNLPGHNVVQFEGRVVRALSNRAILAVGLVFCLVALAFAFRAFSLEVLSGPSYADISRNNTLDRTLVFATRGLILDRNGKELAWNEIPSGTAASSSPYALRKYTTLPGFAHVLGFVQYPKADSKGNWWREEYIGKSGVELAFNDVLRGINGSSMVETDARKAVQRQNIVSSPLHGTDLTLSLDADVQTALQRILSERARAQGYRGGAAVIMDVRTGEILALTSFPEYDNQAFNDGNTAQVRAAR